MAVISIFNPIDLNALNLNTALAKATNVGLHQAANATFNGRAYVDVFEIDFNSGGNSYQDLLLGSGLAVSAGNVLTAGTITGIAEFVQDGALANPNWMIQDISLPAATVSQAYQTSSTGDDQALISAALKGDDIISGSSNGPDRISTGDGNDLIFLGGTGGNVVEGGNGVDSVNLPGLLSDHTVVVNADGSLSINGNTATLGADTLSHVDQIFFGDYKLVFDLASSQDALVYRLYQAAFARTPDNPGFRYWATLADNSHLSAISLADQFLAAPEFSQKYGSLDNSGYATAMYANVLGRAPDPAGIAFWLDQLNKGVPRDQLLVSFAGSAENIQLTLPHMSTGYWTT